MKILVKAAHSFTRDYFSLATIRKSIIKFSDKLEPTLAFCTIKSMVYPKAFGKDKEEDYLIEHVLKNCRDEDRQIYESCLASGQRSRIIRPSVDVRVKPTTTIGVLKSILKQEPWTPKENLELYHCEKRPLGDESSTLLECGIMERDTLLVYMGGSFTIPVFSENHDSLYIPISSCCETIGDLKDKIYEKTGHLPKEQKITNLRERDVVHNDETPLVAIGIVKPYWPKSGYEQRLRFFIPKVGDTELC